MRSLLPLFVCCSLILCFAGAAPPEEKWIKLLDKDLSQWEMYLSFRHKNDYKGDAPIDEQGKLLEPVGYNKNVNNVFSMIEEKGNPILKISGEIYGCVYTKQEFENYHLKLKVKWGSKKWEPRIDKLKDSGILYHSQGKAGVDYWKAWMLSQEFQIMEGHIGDYWTIGTSAIDIRALIPEGQMNPVASEKQPFISIGTGTNFGGFCLRSEDRESPDGEWTDVALICFGDKSLHIVNDKVVMVLRNSHHVDNGKVIPLVKGKIQLQSEAAEVYFKDVEIKQIKEMPKQFAKHFN